MSPPSQRCYPCRVTAPSPRPSFFVVTSPLPLSLIHTLHPCLCRRCIIPHWPQQHARFVRPSTNTIKIFRRRPKVVSNGAQPVRLHYHGCVKMAIASMEPAEPIDAALPPLAGSTRVPLALRVCCCRSRPRACAVAEGARTCRIRCRRGLTRAPLL